MGPWFRSPGLPEGARSHPHGDYRALTVVDGAESFSKLYVYLYHPSGVRGGYWDGSGYSDPGSYAFKISDSSDYSDYKKVTATFLSVSSDLLFWKFRVDYQFPFSGSSERGYDLASFEILNPSASESNSYVLGERFLVSGSGGSTLVTHQTLDVMELNVGVFTYCYSEKNSHTVDYYLDPGFGTASSSSCYTRLLCCAFHFPSSYGTLVGLRLSWAMQQYVLDPASSHDAAEEKSRSRIGCGLARRAGHRLYFRIWKGRRKLEDERRQEDQRRRCQCS